MVTVYVVLKEDQENAINGKLKDSVQEETNAVSGWSPSGKSNRQPCRDSLKGICAKLLRDSGHLPKCHFLSQNRVVNSATGARFRTERLRNNRHSSQNLHRFLRKGTKVLGPIRRGRLTKAAQRHAEIRKIKVHRLVKYRSKFLISAVRTL